ncbi:type II toxin-antitoxin system VapC family toxin [Maricaulaceae bacterium MS644]
MSRRARAHMRAATGLLVSMASIWEANIKRGKHGDLRVGPLAPLLDEIRASGLPEPFQILPVELDDCYAVRDLSNAHGDPFDRMIAAQAMRRGLPVVSADPVFDAYGCERIW